MTEDEAARLREALEARDALIERLCVALDWCYAYLPPEDAEKRAEGRSPRWCIVDPIYSREQSKRDTESARAALTGSKGEGQ